MMRFTTLALSLSVVALLGACGLKGDLYLPTKQPSAASPASQSATGATTKAGDDSKAAPAAPAAK